MSLQEANDHIEQALIDVKILSQRLVAHYGALPHATRNADRIVLANDASSMYLKLDEVEMLLREALGCVREVMPDEENRVPVRCKNCGREGTYITGFGCSGCAWMDDEEID